MSRNIRTIIRKSLYNINLLYSNTSKYNYNIRSCKGVLSLSIVGELEYMSLISVGL